MCEFKIILKINYQTYTARHSPGDDYKVEYKYNTPVMDPEVK